MTLVPTPEPNSFCFLFPFSFRVHYFSSYSFLFLLFFFSDLLSCNFDFFFPMLHCLTWIFLLCFSLLVTLSVSLLLLHSLFCTSASRSSLFLASTVLIFHTFHSFHLFLVLWCTRSSSYGPFSTAIFFTSFGGASSYSCSTLLLCICRDFLLFVLTINNNFPPVFVLWCS